MKVYTKIVLDIETGGIISRETFNYHGPVSLAISGSGSKSKSKSQSQSTQESGTQFNQDFLDKVFNYFNPNPTAMPGKFDPQKYLKDNPDVAADPYFSQHPDQHWARYAETEPWRVKGQSGEPNYTGPDYNPSYVKGSYTPGAYTPGAFTSSAFTPVDGGDFNKIEANLYGSQQSKLRQAYEQNVGRQREELSQMGALNSPAQYLEGSVRSSLDRSFIENLQQAARDASSTALGLKASEAGRKTGFDVGEATRKTGFDVGEGQARTAYDVNQGAARTAFDTSEANRETGFNTQTAQAILDNFWKKIMAALESGKFGAGESTSYGTTSGVSGGGGIYSSSAGTASGKG